VLRRDLLSLDQGHNVGYRSMGLQAAGHGRLGRRGGYAGGRLEPPGERTKQDKRAAGK
jgi:hypothetical protein